LAGHTGHREPDFSARGLELKHFNLLLTLAPSKSNDRNSQVLNESYDLKPILHSLDFYLREDSLTG